jgi:hypothetical protein
MYVSCELWDGVPQGSQLERFLRLTFQAPGQGRHYTERGALFELLGLSQFKNPRLVIEDEVRIRFPIDYGLQRTPGT